MKINNREKKYFFIIPVLLVVLIIKSFYFDEVKNLTVEEEKVVESVYKSMKEEYKGFFNTKIAKFRIVALKVIKKDDNNVYYRLKVRKYIFSILPYRDLIVDYTFELK